VLTRFVSRSTQAAKGEMAQVAVWTAVNILLGAVFAALLAFDDRIAHAIGF